jgi:myo-inositol-1(or 4)-monophosphatase
MSTEENTENFRKTARTAAQAAGEILRDNWRVPKTIDYKGAIDLVTSTDRDSERKIIEVIRQSFPDHSLLAEEEIDIQNAPSEYRWIVDPLDGTTNFAHGYPQFCVSIALERSGRVIFGLVYDPIRDERFEAALGRGATLNDEAMRVSTVSELDKALLATGFPYDRRDFADFYLGYFKEFMIRCQGLRRAGSAALDLCYVACGRFDGFWELKLKPWDIAAGALIVAEAGGRLSDFSGEPFSINGRETLASNRLIHEEMARVAASVKKNPR